MEGRSLELLWVEIRLFHGIVREYVQQSQMQWGGGGETVLFPIGCWWWWSSYILQKKNECSEIHIGE